VPRVTPKFGDDAANSFLEGLGGFLSPAMLEKASPYAFKGMQALGETAANKIAAGEALVPGAGFLNPHVSHVIKPEKGGNWIEGSIEDALSPLKSKRKHVDTTRPITQDVANAIRYDYPHIDEGYAQYFRNNGQHSMHYADDYYKWMAEHHPKEFAELSEGRTPTDYLNKFVDQKIKNYIKNDLATPHDPVRLQAEDKGILHIPAQANHGVTRDVAQMRIDAGFPKTGIANSLLAKQWENFADESLNVKSAGTRVKQGESDSAFDSAKRTLENNPWLKDVPPETRVYNPYSSDMITDHLAFDHIMDELRNAINPHSGLPANLRLKPESLERMTVPQVVEKVAKINEWRSAEAAKAEKLGMKDNLLAKPRLEIPDEQLSFVDKPGMKWVDIPETTDQKAHSLCTTIGKQGGWCTQGKDLADMYGSNNNRLVALLDAEGRPHAQVMMTVKGYDKNKMRMSNLDEDEYIGDQMFKNIASIVKEKGFDKQIQKDAQEYFLAGGKPEDLPKELYDIWPSIEKEALNRIPRKELAIPDITELKPVGNYFSSERALEYEKRDPNYQPKISKSVLEFLNSGESGKVNDLDHFNILDTHDPKQIKEFIRSNYGGDFGFIDPESAYQDFKKAYSSTNKNRFVSSEDAAHFLDNVIPPKPEGYKKGGHIKTKVYLAKNVDSMKYELTRSKK
jgi:hypothetical protein